MRLQRRHQDGHLQPHAHDVVLGTVDLGALAPRLRQVLLATSAYGRSFLVVRRVGRQLARALARGVAGEHERVADEADLPQQQHDDQQQRQDAGELDGGLAALAGQPGQQAARLAVGAGGLARRRAAPRARSRAPRSVAAQLLVLQARRRAGVDGRLERGEVGRDRRLGEPAADDLAREVGLDLALARGLVEQRRACPGRPRAPAAAATGRAAAARRAARRRRAWRRSTTLEAISAPIALASETVEPRSTTVSAWRARTAPSTLRATIESTSSARSPSSGASSSRTPSRCVNSVSCRWRTEISSATSTRSTTLRRYGVSM